MFVLELRTRTRGVNPPDWCEWFTVYTAMTKKEAEHRELEVRSWDSDQRFQREYRIRNENHGQ